MHFNFLAALAFSATAYSAAIPVSLSADQILVALNGLTAKVNLLNAPITAMTSASVGLYPNGGTLGSVIAGIQDIATTAQDLAVNLQTSPIIPSGVGVTGAVVAYQNLATALQANLNLLNSRLALLGNNGAAAVNLNAVLANLQVGLNNLYNQLTLRLGNASSTPIQSPQGTIQNLLNQVIVNVRGLLNGLNIVLNGNGSGTSFLNLPILGNPTGGSVGTGGGVTTPVNNLLNGILGGNVNANAGANANVNTNNGGFIRIGGTNGKGLLGGLLRKRVAAN